ncbi:MAG: hypothetical protein M3478_09700 [Planctomycetota bacterium]|nr:hypothetical protein [Planctomycetota bacterium]
MNEQRPPTSPGAHPAGQPQRVISPQQGPHAPHASQAPRPPQGPSALQPPARPVMRPPPSTASLSMDDDDLVVLDDAVALEDDAQVTAPQPVAAAAIPAPRASEAPAPKKITFGAENIHRTHQWKRKPHVGGQGACRVKTFHGKCSDQGLEYLDDAINVWLDEHPDIEVKFVQSNVGMFDGKFKDFALIVNVWY